MEVTDDTIQLTAREIIMLGANDLIAYGRLHFPRTFRQKNPEMHHEIGKALYGGHRQVGIKIFRGGAKTSLLRVFASKRIAYGISRTIMYVSVSQQHAIFSLRWLKRQIEFNTRWTQLFQLRRGSKWTDEIIEIYHGIDDTPITVLAMGITGQIRGFNLDDYRPDLIIADDILNEENTATIEQRKKIEDLFFGALINSLAPASDASQAMAVLLQTPLDRNDISMQIEKDPDWISLTFSCFDEQGRSRWEERYPTETLERMKESARRAGRYSMWMREMECKIVASEDQAFNTENLQYWDVLPEGGKRVIAIDPASSDSPTADDNVVMTVMAYKNCIYVLEYSAEKGEMPDATAAHFFQQLLKWRPYKAGAEAISFQRVLAWYLETEMTKRRMFLPIDKIQDKRRKSDRILQALSGVIAYRQLYVHPSMTKLVQQLEDFNPLGNGKDDVIDALAMAITMLRPYLREDGDTIDGEAWEIEDDENYTAIEFARGCP